MVLAPRMVSICLTIRALNSSLPKYQSFASKSGAFSPAPARRLVSEMAAH
jgi:hypothetical protein